VKKLFENWNRFLNEQQENPVAARMFAIDSKLPGEGHAGQNWNHNLADAFNMMSLLESEPDDLARVLANYDADYWIKSDKATKSLAMVREIDPDLAQDIVKEALKWKEIKEKITQ
tara:strand:- start:415 stop:759 length:345 start_codon:yes stop_codon:yes gene_type:complete